MDRLHSDWGGSSAERRLQCLLSARLEGKMPAIESEAAKAGTRLHEAIEAVLKAWTAGKTLDACMEACHPLEPDDLYVVRYCCDVAINRLNELAFLGEEPRILLEPKLQLHAHRDFWGFADLVILYSSGFDLLDWKTGRGNVALRNEFGALNASVAFYCQGVLDHPSCPDTIEVIRAYIVQPRNGGVDMDEVTITEIEAATEALLSARRLSHKPAAMATPGDHCTFCRAAPRCVALKDHLMEAVMQIEKDPALIDVKDIEKILDRSKEFRRWLDDVEGYAMHLLQSGKQIGDWAIVPTRPMRKWIDEAAVWERMSGTNIPMDEYAPRKLVTPAQAEKLLKANEIEAVTIDDLSEKVSSGVKLERRQS